MIPVGMTPDWPAPANVRACVTLRLGGVSTGPYASCNLGLHVGDDAAAVTANRRRVADALRLPSEPCWLEQVHGTTIVDLDATASAVLPAAAATASAAPSPGELAASAAPPGASAAASASPAVANAAASAGPPGAKPSASASPPTADGAVTRRPGVVCAVLTADCLPVFFADRGGTRVGVAHAGWRGLAAGVLRNCVAALGVPPGEILAWLGPAIGRNAFEVGDEVREAFAAAGFPVAHAFQRNVRGRWQADLYALARDDLLRAGVRSVFGGGECTYSNPERFFSHRREAPCGRMASLIWIQP